MSEDTPVGPEFRRAPRAHFNSIAEQMRAITETQQNETEVVENVEENIEEQAVSEDLPEQEAVLEEDNINTDENEAPDPVEDADEEPEFLDLDSYKTKMVKVKVDGKEEEVTLEEALKGYSRTQHLSRKSNELAAERKKVEEEVNRIRNIEAQMSQYYQIALDLAQTSNPVLAEAQKTDWKKLEVEDPQKWAILQQKVQQERAKIEAIRNEQARLAASQFETLKKQNWDMLVNDLVPEWQDTSKFEQESGELKTYLLNSGFNQQEVNLVVDARQVVLARKAMMFDKMQKSQKTLQAKKSPPPTSKVAKPGTGKSGPDPRISDLQGRISGERNMRKRAELITQLNRLQRSK